MQLSRGCLFSYTTYSSADKKTTRILTETRKTKKVVHSLVHARHVKLTERGGGFFTSIMARIKQDRYLTLTSKWFRIHPKTKRFLAFHLIYFSTSCRASTRVVQRHGTVLIIPGAHNNVCAVCALCHSKLPVKYIEDS